MKTWLVCCLPYTISIVGNNAAIQTNPFFARVSAETETEARLIGKELAQSTWGGYGNYTAYAVDETALEGLTPWTRDMLPSR